MLSKITMTWACDCGETAEASIHRDQAYGPLGPGMTDSVDLEKRVNKLPGGWSWDQALKRYLCPECYLEHGPACPAGLSILLLDLAEAVSSGDTGLCKKLSLGVAEKIGAEVAESGRAAGPAAPSDLLDLSLAEDREAFLTMSANKRKTEIEAILGAARSVIRGCGIRSFGVTRMCRLIGLELP